MNSISCFKALLNLLVPGHLDRLENRFARFLGIVAEVLEFGDELVELGKAELERGRGEW